MNQEQAIDLLSAAVDRPLTTTEQAALEAWIAADPDHQALADGIRQQHTQLQATFAPRREAITHVVQTVTQGLTPATVVQPPARWRRVFSPVPAGLITAIIIGVAVYAFRPTPPETITPHRDTVAKNTARPGIGLMPQTKPNDVKATAIKIGDQIGTVAGEKRRLLLPDGSILYVNQQTKATLLANRHLKLLAGEIFIEAVPASIAQTTFLVDTPNRSVTALGTKFAVSAIEAGTGVIVTQGKVEVSSVAEPVNTGEQLKPTDNRPTSAPRAACAVEWTRELMIAAESPLVPAGKHSGGSLVAVDPYGQESKLSMVKYHVDVHIEGGFVRTTIDQTYFNHENQQLEGTFYFPLPPDASLNRLAMYVDGNRMEGGMAEREHARDVYETIRHQRRDPALLEWVDGSVFKMRVFPLAAREEKRILLSYTQRINSSYGRSTYRFPSGHTFSHVNEWSFSGVIKNAADTSIMSPSHPTMKITPNGNDVQLQDAMKNTRIDRDIVLEMHNHQEAAITAESSQFTDYTQDGERYLLMKYKPDLPLNQRRERRDWVFLFEASGERNPLIARTQIELIRSMLRHAEHEDTFNVLTIGTRIHSFRTALIPATTANSAEAIQWLEQSHLIGALNVAEGFQQAATLLSNARNPHVVHVGSGIASYGEQRADLLREMLPQTAKYIGLAVGKRFSTTLMKATAEKTGGLFINVNPDEAISWRGFEIMSMLNAPRLLNITLSVPTHPELKFLPFAESVAHGEELMAIARVTKLHVPAVMVHGLIDGQAFRKEVPVTVVKPGAGHLPRSWAKLEIDRLLAENASLHQTAITTLSKQMYVMTPFTSLLVLENEQMYRDFKVDRGRHDHWAMYPVPDKIPVVFIPDPNNPNAVRGAIAGQKPHENQVLTTIFTRTPPQVLQGPRIPGQPSAVQNAAQRFGQVAFHVIDADGEEDYVDFLKRGEKLEKALGEDFYTQGLNTEFRFEERLGEQESLQLFAKTYDNRTPMSREWHSDGLAVQNRPIMLKQLKDSNVRLRLTDRISGKSNRPELRQRLVRLSDGRFNKGEEVDRKKQAGRFAGWDVANDFGVDKFYDLAADRPVELMAFFADDQRSKMRKRIAQNGRELAVREEVLKQQFWGMQREQLDRETRGTGEEDKPEVVAERPTLPFYINEPAYYNRPTFAFTDRLFRDLLSQAPGMSSLPADVRAVVEAEAAPRFGTKRGKIDANAQALIDASRLQVGWRRTEFTQPDGTRFAIFHDGQGRYRYERQGRFGLKEIVVCDGQTLWHNYPEIGVGAKRTVSRFHRAEMLELMGDVLPPAEDLNHGADVVLKNDHTVAIIPHPQLDDDGNPLPWIETQFIFTAGKFTTKKWVLQPKTEVVQSAAFRDNGDIVLMDGQGKTLAQMTLKHTSVTAPSLSPDNQQLVVLPLPLRTRDIVYPKLGLDPNYGLFDGPNPCWVDLNEASLLELLSCELGTGSSSVENITSVLWYSHNDRRPGLNVLRAAINYYPLREADEAFEQQLIRDPLTRYLHREFDEFVRDLNRKFGFALPAAPKDDFLNRLHTLRVIYDRFSGGYTNHRLWGIRDTELERAMLYVRQHPESSLAWAAMGLVANISTSNQMDEAKAATWGKLIDKSPFPYAARYEQARSLVRAGKSAEAMPKFQTLFREALTAGVLPPVDADFRSVQQQHSATEWPNLMRAMAKTCVDKKARPVVVLLAWQCWQLGDVALSDTMLDIAMADVPTEERAHVTLWSVQFLHRTGRQDRAELQMRTLLSQEKLANSPKLWRLGYQIANATGDQVNAIERLEKALDIEYQHLPETVDITPIRQDYQQLMNHYEWLADAAQKLNVPAPADLPSRIIKNMDRWRHLDASADTICQQAGATLRKIGGAEAKLIAWDYETTPLAMKPNESGPWEQLATTLRRQNDWQAADRAYAMAFLAEPTNAQLLWNRAQYLKDQGQQAEAQRLFKQLAAGKWQERFASLVTMAQAASEGR